MRIEAHTWRALSTLLDQALELPDHAHEAWLASLRADQAALEPMLRELLQRRAAPETRDFLERLPAFTLTDSADGDEDNLRAGAVVGAYRLIRQVGQGGMGAVWLAERVDGLIKREVALKLPHLQGS